MAGTSWQFTSNGGVYDAAAWADAFSRLTPYVQPPVKADPLSQTGVAATSVGSTQLLAENLNRSCVEIGNPATARLWIQFGAGAAAVGDGIFVPPGATVFYYSTSRVAGRLETGANVTIGLLEWG